MKCPTIRIKATTGSYPFTTINEADFDAAKHTLYVEGDATSPATPLEASAPTPSKKEGRKTSANTSTVFG